MTKSIWAGVVALVIVVACGVVEVAVLTDGYNSLAESCQEMIAKAEDETITEDEFENFANKWLELREQSELLLPHNDVYELNLRVAEARSYVKSQDYKQLHAQLTVVSELLDYIPHLMQPSFKHIF